MPFCFLFFLLSSPFLSYFSEAFLIVFSFLSVKSYCFFAPMFCHLSSWFKSVNDVLVHHDTFCSFSSLFRSCFPFFLSFVFSILFVNIVFFFFGFALVSTCESVFKIINRPPRRFVSISFRLFLLRPFILFLLSFFFFVCVFVFFISFCLCSSLFSSFPFSASYFLFVLCVSSFFQFGFISYFFSCFSYKLQKNKEKKTTEMFFCSVHFIFIHLTS